MVIDIIVYRIRNAVITEIGLETRRDTPNDSRSNHRGFKWSCERKTMTINTIRNTIRNKEEDIVIGSKWFYRDGDPKSFILVKKIDMIRGTKQITVDSYNSIGKTVWNYVYQTDMLLDDFVLDGKVDTRAAIRRDEYEVGLSLDLSDDTFFLCGNTGNTRILPLLSVWKY